MDARSDVGTGPQGRPGRIAAVLGWAAALALVAAAVVAWAGGTGLGHRSVATMSERVPIGQGIDTVRLEIQNGTIGVDVPLAAIEGSTVDYQGGVRRAADTAEQLAELERMPFTLQASPDPARPGTLVLRGPTLPAGSAALLALEIGVRLPAAIALEVVVPGSGHVTVARRTGSTVVETGRGDLRFEHVAGPVRAETGRGNVIAFDHRGDLDLRTRVGDMQAFVREPGTVLRLVTGQGTVQCGLPETAEFEIDARAEVGRIGADFGLVAEKVGSYGAVLVGARGSKHTKVVLRTGSGHLSFKAKTFE
jgi:hypothetical protein